MRQRPAVFWASFATVIGGVLVAGQARANGSLADALGLGLFAAVISFSSGLLYLSVSLVATPAGRKGVRTLVAALRTQQLSVWMLFGGVFGATLVLTQSTTVPVLGVALFTVAFVAGQLIGALLVDRTSLPPSGRTPITVQRVLGAVIVLVGVIVSVIHSMSHGVPIAATLFSVGAGALTAAQIAMNGRVQAASHSTLTATFVNFLMGTVFLVVICLAVWIGGTRPEALPSLPHNWWMYVGGALGVGFVSIKAITVKYLGVLRISLLTVCGTLVGSLLLDVMIPGGPPVSWLTILALALMALGVACASLKPRQQRGQNGT